MRHLQFSALCEEELTALAQKLAAFLEPYDFLAFYGDLGAGKTTFIRAMAEKLGIEDVTSPTFTLVQEHAGKLPFFHFDAYRLADAEELYAIGFIDYLKRGGVIAMEWCENVPSALPAERLEIHISGSGAQGRDIKFIACSPRYTHILEALSS